MRRGWEAHTCRNMHHFSRKTSLFSNLLAPVRNASRQFDKHHIWVTGQECGLDSESVLPGKINMNFSLTALWLCTSFSLSVIQSLPAPRSKAGPHLLPVLLLSWPAAAANSYWPTKTWCNLAQDDLISSPVIAVPHRCLCLLLYQVSGDLSISTDIQQLSYLISDCISHFTVEPKLHEISPIQSIPTVGNNILTSHNMS